MGADGTRGLIPLTHVRPVCVGDSDLGGRFWEKPGWLLSMGLRMDKVPVNPDAAPHGEREQRGRVSERASCSLPAFYVSAVNDVLFKDSVKTTNKRSKL